MGGGNNVPYTKQHLIKLFSEMTAIEQITIVIRFGTDFNLCFGFCAYLQH